MESKMMNKLRGALRSLTIWINSLALLALANIDFIAASLSEYLPALGQVLPKELVFALSVALTLFNVYQRTRTNQSLAEKGVK